MPSLSDPGELTIFRSLVDQTNMLVYIMDAESAIVVDVSEATWRTAGLERDALVGKSARTLRTSYPLQTAADWRAFVSLASAPGGALVNFDLANASGGTFPADLQVMVREFGGRRYLVATGRALSGSPRVYADLERRHTWQRALLELATHPAITTGDLNLAIQLLAQKAREAMPCAGASLWLRDAAVPAVLRAQGVGSGLAAAPNTEIDLAQYPEFLELLEARRAADDVSAALLEPLAALGAMACLAAPIRLAGAIVGVLTFFHDRHRNWSVEDIAFAGALAEQAAAALSSAESRIELGLLRESEKRYRNFVKNAGEGIWRIEFPVPIRLSLPVDEQVRLLSTGLVAECNDALAKMGGFDSVEDVRGLPLSQILPFEDERARKTLRQMVRCRYRVQDLATPHFDRQGRERWILRNVEGVIEDGHLVRLWGCSRDITKRRRAEDLVYNLARARTQSDFFKSLALHLAQSLSASEVTVIEFPHPGDEPEVLARVVDGDFVNQAPDWLPHFDADASNPRMAARPLLDSQGQRCGLLVVWFTQEIAEDQSLVDLTLAAFAARASAELECTRYYEQLQRSEQRYRSFVEYSSESIWRVDLRVPLSLSWPEERQVDHLRNHAFLAECNEATVQYLGYDSPAQLIGLPLMAFFPEQVPDRTRELLEIVRSGYRLSHQDSWHDMPDGTRRWFGRCVVGIRDQENIIRIWGVSRDVTEHKAMERQIRALSARRQNVLEEERARISREIHDDLGQQLSALKMYLGSKTRRDDLALGEAVALIDAAIDSTRRIAVNLRPPVLDHFGLAAAVEGHVREVARTTGLIFDCDVQEDISVVPEQALAIFRILQESLANVHRHSGATAVMVTLIEEESDLVLRVSDNGHGLAAGRNGGMGLVGMRERASAYGGELTITSKPERGTAVEARFPLSSDSGP